LKLHKFFNLGKNSVINVLEGAGGKNYAIFLGRGEKKL